MTELCSLIDLLLQKESVEVRAELKGELKGRISTILEDLRVCKAENVKLIQRESSAEEKLVEAEKAVLILQVRSRIEELEKKFLLPYMVKKWTRYEKWDMIMRGDMRHYGLRMQTELQSFRSSVTMNVQQLIETVVSVYGEFSDVAAHDVHYSVNYDENSVVEMLKKCKILNTG